MIKIRKLVFASFAIILVLILFLYPKFKNILANVVSSSNKKTSIASNTSNKDEKDQINKEDTKAQEVFKTISLDGPGLLIHGISREMTTSSFWTNQPFVDNKIIMKSDEISDFNEKITTKVPTVNNLENYSTSLSKDALTSYIQHYKLPSTTMYDYSGKAITKSFYSSLIENTNLSSISNSNIIRYGLSIKKASIRSFPTESAIYNSSNTRTLDRFQETGCEPCEPVLILHESKDKLWYFVQIYNYRGWIKSDSVAIANDKNDVFNYYNSKDFIMITGKQATCNINSSKTMQFSLGTKLPLEKSIKNKASAEYTVILPFRNSSGELYFENGTIPFTEDVCEGFLPYTKYNLVNEAFKLQGLTYDWGDKYSGRDCSSFILCIYKTFGFKLPRNTDEQEACSDSCLKFDASSNIEKRETILDQLSTGNTLYMPGHTMLYLGKYNNNYYMIHAFLGYSDKTNGSLKYNSVFQVAVTAVNIDTSTGTPFIQEFTSALKFEK